MQQSYELISVTIQYSQRHYDKFGDLWRLTLRFNAQALLAGRATWRLKS